MTVIYILWQKNEAGALANYYGLKLKPNNRTLSGLKGKVVSETRVNLNWSGTENVTWDSIYRSMNPFDSFEYVGSTVGTGYRDSQSAPTTYYYKVRAYY